MASKTLEQVAKPAKTNWPQALAFVAGCMVPGFLSSYLGGAFQKQDWYDKTAKPAIWPPQWVFPAVWTGNYNFMGLALWRAWQNRGKPGARWGLALFAAQMLHNVAFIPLVYRVKKRSFYVLMDSIGLTLVALTTQAFARISRPANRLMLPYLAWCAFTTLIKVWWWRMENPSK